MGAAERMKNEGVGGHRVVFFSQFGKCCSAFYFDSGEIIF